MTLRSSMALRVITVIVIPVIPVIAMAGLDAARVFCDEIQHVGRLLRGDSEIRHSPGPQ